MNNEGFEKNNKGFNGCLSTLAALIALGFLIAKEQYFLGLIALPFTYYLVSKILNLIDD